IDDQQQLTLRDWRNGQVKWSSPCAKGPHGIEFSDDGLFVLAAFGRNTESVLCVWETATGREVERMSGRGDLGAIARDYGKPHVRLVSRGPELVAETHDGRVLGRMPMSDVKRIVTAPSGLTWAIQTLGARCPQVVTIEGVSAP